MEENNIGWNFWTHKKVEKISSPFSAVVTPQYQTLINYWSGNGSQPSATYAEAALIGFANSLKLENCDFLPGVIASLTDPEYGEISKPYSIHSIPGIIPAVEYDIGAWGLSYTDSDYYNNGDGNYNDGWSFRNDGVDIEANGDSDGLPYNVGWTDAGEWLRFTIQDVTPGTYDVRIRVAALSSGGIFFVQLNGTNLGVIDVPGTGGWYEWQNIVIPDIEVSSGEQILKIQIVQAGFNIEKITFESVTSSIEDPVILDQFMLGDPYPNPFNPSVMMDLTNHEASDAAGDLLGDEERGFWRDHKSAKVNAIRTKNLIEKCDIAIIRFGDKYKQWNAAFDAGYCAALGKPYITLHNEDIIHPLKEIDAAAHAWATTPEQIVKILSYINSDSLN